MSRIQAREFAFKMIFSFDFLDDESNVNFVKVENGYKINEDYYKVNLTENEIIDPSDISFSTGLINSFLNNLDKIDNYIKKYVSSYKFSRIYKSDLAVLRLAIAELLEYDYDYKIVINEAVDLSKKYGDENSYKFVHGVLANIVKEIRNE